jgi:DegV family protein with EDD domain
MSAAPVAIVTDSSSDIDPALAAQLGISVVPLYVNFGDARFTDGIELSHAEYYNRLRAEKALPTTSQPTAAMFEAAYAPSVAEGRSIVSVHIMSRVSGTINAARAGAQALAGSDVRLVDSSSVCAGTALLAIYAAELARDGASADAIVAELERARTTQRGVCAVPDLSHLARTGRIGKAASLVGGLLKIVPVLRLDRGEVEVEARLRTLSRAKDAMVEAIVAAAGDRARFRAIVMHANAGLDAEDVRERLRAKLGTEAASLSIGEAGPVIATYAGEGAIGIFALAG